MDVININEVINKNINFLKIDVEGEEFNILNNLISNFDNLDEFELFCEIGSIQNSEKIYEIFRKVESLSCYSQKNNWAKVLNFYEMPTSYKEGRLYLTNTGKKPW